MPDAPWSSRASYYVDSGYRGADPGRAVETAFTVDLVGHVDATYRTLANRSGRGIAGYSMGGYGAMRYSLAHPELFGAAIVLSPAVYFPEPPADSSTREFGAFGSNQAACSREDLQAAELPGDLRVVRGHRSAAADVHRRRRRRVQEHESQRTTSTTSTSRRTSSTTRPSGSTTCRPSSASSTAVTTGTSGGRSSSRARSTSSSS